jgi:hypothetical protein
MLGPSSAQQKHHSGELCCNATPFPLVSVNDEHNVCAVSYKLGGVDGVHHYLRYLGLI